ncbi:hypothetical protein [Mycetocola zhadangensis]|uniref:DUF1257 domain-containing protein n=1 Tax=Mycetocola zhadangensis TaxID=1164595 RepID=A0A3L7J1X6_9MICO|nr:hypothetical protein [Mycetocola zhadangensis]RLQ84255.1 hypothetical protein D9V28_08580 [Mycetocola zhadangensis]GGE94686.1 hypothetical protein GCM10011313_17080 [Mycetocola zhadangensis]
MSVTLVLLPIALAAAAAAGGVGVAGAVHAAKNTDDVEAGPTPAVRVRTRMKDSTLLADALNNLGATAVTVTRSTVSAQVDDVLLTMTLSDDGIWEAHIESLTGQVVTEATAAELIARLDAEYAAGVQQAVAEKIRLRAADSGFDLVSETRDVDDTVTMVLNVRAEA